MTDIEIQIRIKEIDEEVERLSDIISEKDQQWFADLPNKGESMDMHYKEYLEYCEPERGEIKILNRERRMIQPIEYSELSTFGDVMTLAEFMRNVKDGGFIDYDGFGRYVKDGKETNIEIYPSDVKRGTIREGFDTIIWFNR